MKTSGGKILLMECKNAPKHHLTAHIIANRSALSLSHNSMINSHVHACRSQSIVVNGSAGKCEGGDVCTLVGCVEWLSFRLSALRGARVVNLVRFPPDNDAPLTLVPLTSSAALHTVSE